MDQTILISVMAGLLVVSILLVVVYVIAGRPKKEEPQEEIPVTFETFRSVIEKPLSGNIEINRAVDTILECYGDIVEERPLEVYEALLHKLCNHPNTDSRVILRFQRGLISINPRFKMQLETTLRKGISKRK